MCVSNVRDFGAIGDGRVDSTDAIQHAVNDGDGIVKFPRGDYRLTRTIEVDLTKRPLSRTALDGSGGTAKLIMDGEGPAISFKAGHTTTAAPDGFRPEEWQHERMPTIDGLEIVGRNPKADGVRIEGVMQPTLTRLLIRQVRTAIHVTKRARNLIIDHCHIYHNTGVGVHLDNINLHQACITGSHISYCRLGGVRIENSEIRNLQITGNDIEYNNNKAHREQFPDADAVPTAEVYIDVGQGTVREGTIASNTLQATYSPGGANIRFIGRAGDENHKVGMWTISGNLIGSQMNNIHLTSARGVTISGNYIYSGHHRNLLVENSRNIVLGPNCFGHNPDYNKNELATGIRFVDSENCNISGVLIEDAEAGRHTLPDTIPLKREGLIELLRCRRVNLSGSQVLDGTPYGIVLDDCRDTLLDGCTVLDDREPKQMKAAILWRGDGAGNMVSCSRIGRGMESDLIAPAHVRRVENQMDSE